MSLMIIDGIRSLTLHGNVVRVHCIRIGQEGKQEDAGTLLIPGTEVGAIMQALVKGLQDMQKQIRERPAPADAPKPVTN